jgi:hypothetical protein
MSLPDVDVILWRGRNAGRAATSPVSTEGGTMKVRTIGIMLVGVALTFAVTGCGLIAQQAIQKATGVSVDKNGNQVTVTGPNGQKATVAGDQNKLPDGLPSTVPAYAGTVKTSASVTTDKGTTYTFVIQTSDDVATVAKWYKGQLTDKGWKIEALVNGGNASIVTAKLGSSSIQVQAGPDSSGGGTAIAVVANMAQ